MRFSVTERGTFRRCRRQAILTSKNGEHLTPMIAPIYLSVGTIIHKGKQNWLLNPAESFQYHTLSACVEEVEKLEARYLRQIGKKISEEEREPLHKAIGFANAMAENYQIKWGTPLPEGFSLISPEQKVLVPVPGTERACTCADAHTLAICPDCYNTGIARHYLECRFDALLQDSSGAIWILENKTYSTRPGDDSLRRNDQFLAYLWAATQLNIGDVVGLAYDGLWRRDAVPRGRTFDDLFLRLSLTRSKAELDEFERYLPHELNDMAQLYAHPETAYPNKAWTGCFDCGMVKLCDAMSRKENVDYVRAQYYTERTDDVEVEVTSAVST